MKELRAKVEDVSNRNLRYRLIKDHRTGVEKGNVDAVLDGDLDDYVTAMLLGVRNPNRPTD